MEFGVGSPASLRANVGTKSYGISRTLAVNAPVGYVDSRGGMQRHARHVPWGAGATSFESLFTRIPVVTLPSEVSILELVAGQVNTTQSSRIN